MPETQTPGASTQPSAADLCADLQLDGQATALLQPGQRPREFFDLLMQNKLYGDAIRFLARALPKRIAVGWGAGCVRPELDTPPRAEEAACLAAAEKWAANPDEANRRMALEAAEGDGYQNPSAWVAAAAGWSSGSLSPPDMPEVPAPDHLTAQAVAGALIVVSAKTPESTEEKQFALIQQGLQMSGGLT